MTHAAVLIISFFAVLLFICVFALVWMLITNKKSVQNKVLSSQDYLIIYASQSGQTEHYAKQTASQLHQAGEAVACLNIQDLQLEHLEKASKVLWMVSTYGEGDAPDTAQHFQQNFLKKSFHFDRLSFAVLAFGDRRYTHFCQFGMSLNEWLLKQNAHPLFDVVCVDQLSKTDLDLWLHHLAQVTHHQFEIEQVEKHWVKSALRHRTLLNAGSSGQPLYHLGFERNELIWKSGDILEVWCANSNLEIKQFLGQHAEFSDQSYLEKLKHKNLRKPPQRFENESLADWLQRFEELETRDYSIASIPEQNQIELVVRQQCDETGLGLGSGWLTSSAEIGEDVVINIRNNTVFHLENTASPMIFIGNGSGIAGLLSHLNQRQRNGFEQNWLIFGEREQQFDFLFKDQLTQWNDSGFLKHLDMVFSRDEHPKKYVQDLILEKADQLKNWVDQGAYIYVCGSLNGMAQGLDDALRRILGEVKFEKIRLEQRYRRDVY
jgi:sulfite reductase (NADPH) flavoprotein alpha-component